MLDLRYQPTPSSPTGNYHHGRHQPQSSTTVTLALLLLLLLLKRPTRRPLEFPRILPRHARFVASAFAAFPEAVAFLADEPLVAEAAVFGAIVLFAGTWEMSVERLGLRMKVKVSMEKELLTWSSSCPFDVCSWGKGWMILQKPLRGNVSLWCNHVVSLSSNRSIFHSTRCACVCVCVVRNENPTRLQSANALSEVAASAPMASTSVVWPTGASQQAYPKPLSLLRRHPFGAASVTAWHGTGRAGKVL